MATITQSSSRPQLTWLSAQILVRNLCSELVIAVPTVVVAVEVMVVAVEVHTVAVRSTSMFLALVDPLEALELDLAEALGAVLVYFISEMQP
jgi:hypothetical protein